MCVCVGGWNHTSEVKIGIVNVAFLLEYLSGFYVFHCYAVLFFF